MQNMNPTAIFFFNVILRLDKTGRGSRVIKMSSAMLNAAPEKRMVVKLTHLPAIVGIQTEASGAH